MEYPSRYQMSQKHSNIVDALAARGWVVTQDFLPANTIEALVEESRRLLLAGRFSRAGVGRGAEHQVRADVRSDQILWLDENELAPAQSRYWSEVESLRAELNKELFLGLVSFESHYAFYPPGAFYRKHVDRFSDSDERAISCSLYLNSDWKEEDGGQLRLYVGAQQIEIFPRAGTFVIFRSDNISHEVLPASRQRFSLTGWFRRRSIHRPDLFCAGQPDREQRQPRRARNQRGNLQGAAETDLERVLDLR